MNSSLISMISSAITAARGQGLKENEQKAAACAVIMAWEPGLTIGVARVLVDSLLDFGVTAGA